MTRISPKDVAEVLDTELESSALMAFVSDAHNIVNSRCEPHSDDEEMLAAVETYLAAHLATAKEPRVSSTSGTAVDVELETDAERYWNQAVLMDDTGRLAKPSGGYPVCTT